jgi:tetratricopeptide (TPR) repeat protein
MREYHALSELRHPRIIDVYDYGVERDVPYYTMELLDGADLHELAPLPYREACMLLRDVASSLALLHARRLLHRDVSPRNVRRTSDNHCKLLDFGAMIAFGVPPNVTGTAPCIAPEALQGGSLDQRSDLYSLGALAYSVLTGRHAYAVSQLSELQACWAQPLKHPKRLAEIPDRLDELVMSLLSLDPGKRPRSAAEVIDSLAAIAQLPPDSTPGVAQSFLTSTQLVGRSAVCDELAKQCQRAADGHGRALMLAADAGTGKTRMLSESMLLAQACGLTPVHAVMRNQRGSGYGLAQDLLAAVELVMPAQAQAAGAKNIVWPNVRQVANYNAQDPAEERANLQQTVIDVLCGLARERPMLVTVDDVERGDEFSLGLLTGLVHRAATLPLLIVVTQTTRRGDDASRVSLVRGPISRMLLSDMTAAQSELLVSSMFGNVPNIGWLSEWLYRHARGNPKLTLQLAEHLVQRSSVRYIDGTWIIPNQPITLQLPPDLEDASLLGTAALSGAALALAEVLSVRRGSVTIDLTVSVAEEPPGVVFAALDELVKAAVLESAGASGGYVFAQEPLRLVLEKRLSEDRRRNVHRRWANVLLTAAGKNLEHRLEAGWHLIHTEDERRGADMLADIAPYFVEQGQSLETAIPAMEKTLEVYERQHARLDVILRLRSALVLAGYLFDYRLAFRYGAATLSALREVTGLDLSVRLQRVFGPTIGFALAFVWTMFRRLWLPADRRGPGVYMALRYFVRTALGLLGVHVIGFDAPAVVALAAQLKPLAGLPRISSGPLIYRYFQVFATQTLGSESELRKLAGQALAMLERKRPRDMTAFEHQSLVVGLLSAEGVNESYREGSLALGTADKLERIGTRRAQGAALRIRMIYYARRGDTERAERCRHLIDLHAIQGGTVWQADWFTIPIEAMTGAVWGDIVAQRRALDRLERLAKEVPSLATMRDSVRIAYHLRRGEFARAVEFAEVFLAQHAPRSYIGWPSSYGNIAQALIEVGEPERAKQVCERALQQCSEEDLSYFALYSPLEAAYAIALAACGEPERGRIIVRRRIDSLRAHDELSSLVPLYQAEARIAQLAGDDSGVEAALKDMRAAALTCGLPAAILLADRLRASVHRSSPRPPAPSSASTPAVSVPTRQDGAERTAVTEFLSKQYDPQERTSTALWFFARYVRTDEAHLYRVEQNVMRFLVSAPAAEEQLELTAMLRGQLSATHSQLEQLHLTVLDGDGHVEERSYRALELTNASAEHTGYVLIRESTETLVVVSAKMLGELAAVLA